MENAHPVPQNVTSFEFRLIGDMTLKQFLYLASGMGIAYLTFLVLAKPLPFLAWPIITVSALLGIAFAFLPISDRPLDYWVGAFLKAIYSPTMRTWSKNNLIFSQSPLFPQRLNIYLAASLASQTTTLIPIVPTIQVSSPPITSQAVPQPVMQPAPVSTPPPPTLQPPQPQQNTSSLPTADQLTKTVELAKQAQTLQAKILEGERKLDEVKAKADLDQFNSVLANLQKLVQEAQTIKRQLSAVSGESSAPSAAEVKVEIVKPVKAKNTQLSLTSFPNIINGIITDSLGNYLDAVVVVIYNKDGLPVRALKTNKLGQFTGSTPLPNGTYRIELEKDSLMFDMLQLELDGKVLPPLMIRAKKVVGNS